MKRTDFYIEFGNGQRLEDWRAGLFLLIISSMPFSLGFALGVLLTTLGAP
jgi:hypothetical protein